MNLQRILVVYRAGSAISAEWAQRCTVSLRNLGAEVLTGATGAYDNPYPAMLSHWQDQKIDLALVLGGDGSTLGAARYLAPYNVPILAINTGGHLGFLTHSADTYSDIALIWERLQTDRFAIEKRMMLQAQVIDVPYRSSQALDGENQPDLEHLSTQSETQHHHHIPFLCLNEMCVKPASLDRMVSVTLEVEIDGEVVDQYHGDGLLVATPTGSTSYTIAANGPMLHPGMLAMVITPICPLSLSSRAIVLPPKLTVNIWPLLETDDSIKVWTDGVLATSLLTGQKLEISMANCEAQFVILNENYSYYGTLREKLFWSGTRIRHQNPYR
ncbi:MAG: NAD(+) kinase [Pseudanabaena sp. ELA607]